VPNDAYGEANPFSKPEAEKEGEFLSQKDEKQIEKRKVERGAKPKMERQLGLHYHQPEKGQYSILVYGHRV